MKDLLSLAVLALIILSKVMGVFLVLAGLIMSPLMIVLFAIEYGFSLPEAVLILGYGLALLVVGGLLIKIPTLKMWPGPDLKLRDEEIA